MYTICVLCTTGLELTIYVGGRGVWRSTIQPVVIGGWVLRDTIVIFFIIFK